MTFSDAEKAAIVSIWGKVAGNENAVGAEALDKMFQSFPQTKTYFSHFDLSHGSADLQRHGGKVLGALRETASHLDNLEDSVVKLSDLHAFNLRVDPRNFGLLADSISANRFPEDFNSTVHAALDKFLAMVSLVLTSKYS